MSAESTESGITKLETLQASLQACRLQGYDRIAPLRFYYLAELVERTASRPQDSDVFSQRLLTKASRLLKEFQDACQHKKNKTQPVSAGVTASSSIAALKALNSRLKKRLDLNEPNQAVTQERLPRQDLQAVKHYQQMFEKMAVERLLNRVMQEIPENAGPLNPERMVIRCLSALQDISPAYAMRLISYYESLICLQSLPLQDK